jgi:hypothetical protein
MDREMIAQQAVTMQKKLLEAWQQSLCANACPILFAPNQS